MELKKNIYDFVESLFDVKEIAFICRLFGVDFEAFDVQCNSSDEAIFLSGRLYNADLQAIANILETLSEYTSEKITINFRNDFLTFALL